MKLNELTGIYFHMDVISPEAFQAQRMAELEQMAKYRSIRIQQYKDWSDPVKREKIKTQYSKDEAEGRKLLATVSAEQVAVRTGQAPLNIKLNYIGDHGFIPKKRTIWQIIRKWFRRFE